MKTIQISVPNDREILRQVLSQSPEGMTLDEMRRAMRVLDRLEAATDALSVEDADFPIIAKRFSATRWVRVDRDILSLADRIDQAANA